MQYKKILTMSGIAALLIIIAIAVQNMDKNKAPEETLNTGYELVQKEAADMQPTKEASLESAAYADLTEEEPAIYNTEAIEITEDIKAQVHNLIKLYYAENGDTNDEILLNGNKNATKEEENQSRREIVEKYKNLKTYVKPGIDKTSLIVFSTYNIKFKNITTLAPGMSVLCVKEDADGVLKISDTLEDETLNAYIQQLSEEEDIKSIIKRINTNLEKAIKADDSLKMLVEYLS